MCFDLSNPKPFTAKNIQPGRGPILFHVNETENANIVIIIIVAAILRMIVIFHSEQSRVTGVQNSAIWNSFSEESRILRVCDSTRPPQKDLIVLNDMHRVFAIDALASSHPLSSEEEEIYKPEQISELFDAISYSKVRPSALFSLTPEIGY